MDLSIPQTWCEVVNLLSILDSCRNLDPEFLDSRMIDVNIGSPSDLDFKLIAIAKGLIVSLVLILVTMLALITWSTCLANVSLLGLPSNPEPSK